MWIHVEIYGDIMGSICDEHFQLVALLPSVDTGTVGFLVRSSVPGIDPGSWTSSSGGTVNVAPIGDNPQYATVGSGVPLAPGECRLFCATFTLCGISKSLCVTCCRPAAGNEYTYNSPGHGGGVVRPNGSGSSGSDDGRIVVVPVLPDPEDPDIVIPDLPDISSDYGGVVKLQLASGNAVYAYVSSSMFARDYLPVDMIGIPSGTGRFPRDFLMLHDDVIVDVFFPFSGGVLELIRDRSSTGYIFDSLANRPLLRGRQKWDIPLFAGSVYSLRILVPF